MRTSISPKFMACKTSVGWAGPEILGRHRSRSLFPHMQCRNRRSTRALSEKLCELFAQDELVSADRLLV